MTHGLPMPRSFLVHGPLNNLKRNLTCYKISRSVNGEHSVSIYDRVHMNISLIHSVCVCLLVFSLSLLLPHSFNHSVWLPFTLPVCLSVSLSLTLSASASLSLIHSFIHSVCLSLSLFLSLFPFLCLFLSLSKSGSRIVLFWFANNNGDQVKL